ncbi:MAG: DUF192 domain-containing protein [Caldilineaceae bacterium]|nr:DUF192 domain-containing protein [Caldilineaceae bacterium]
MLYVDNLSRNTRLIDQGRIANSFWTRLRGLTFVRHLEAGEGLVITRTNSIHTHFMFMPIDVLYVDKQDKIVDITPSMKPWRMALPRRKAHYVIELPSGAIAETDSCIGDQLQIVSDF